MAQLSWLRIPEQIDVHLVNPTKGGAGRLLSSTEIEFEAVLANPLPQLPEVARLGWLCACLASTGSPKANVTLIPAIIAAAEHVELARLDESSIQCALQHWISDEPSLASGQQLFQWWNKVGSAALDQVAWAAAIEQL
jgi:hypothetical protein